MSLDITGTLAPDSSQINADDLIGGPITITVRDVTKGTDEQPVNIHSHEYPNRAYRPSKTMRRLIANAWGTDAAAYAGRRITLFRNPEITFGRDKVGGVEISALSDIDKPLTVALAVSRGKRKNFTVSVLAPTQHDTTIPADVIANTQKAITNGTAADYIAWLTEHGAPQFIIDYVTKETA